MNKLKQIFSGHHEKDQVDHPAAQGSHGEFLDHTRHNDNISEGTGYATSGSEVTGSTTGVTGATGASSGLASDTKTSPSSSRAYDNDRGVTGTSGSYNTGTQGSSIYDTPSSTTGSRAAEYETGASSTNYTSGSSETTGLSSTLDPTSSSRTSEHTSGTTGGYGATGATSGLGSSSTTGQYSSGTTSGLTGSSSERVGEILPGRAHISGQVVGENDPAFREIVQDLRSHGTETGPEWETGVGAAGHGYTGSSSYDTSSTSGQGLVGKAESAMGVGQGSHDNYGSSTTGTSSYGTSSTSGQGVVGKAEQELGVGSGSRDNYGSSTTGVSSGTSGSYDQSGASTGGYGRTAEDETETSSSSGKPSLLQRAENALGMGKQ